NRAVCAGVHCHEGVNTTCKTDAACTELRCIGRLCGGKSGLVGSQCASEPFNVNERVDSAEWGSGLVCLHKADSRVTYYEELCDHWASDASCVSIPAHQPLATCSQNADCDSRYCRGANQAPPSRGTTGVCGD